MTKRITIKMMKINDKEDDDRYDTAQIHSRVNTNLYKTSIVLVSSSHVRLYHRLCRLYLCCVSMSVHTGCLHIQI